MLSSHHREKKKDCSAASHWYHTSTPLLNSSLLGCGQVETDEACCGVIVCGVAQIRDTWVRSIAVRKTIVARSLHQQAPCALIGSECRDLLAESVGQDDTGVQGLLEVLAVTCEVGSSADVDLS